MLKEFLRNKSGKPIIGLAVQVNADDFVGNEDVVFGKMRVQVEDGAKMQGVKIGEVHVETFREKETVWVKAWAEILEDA